jgi:hypothetical protein
MSENVGASASHNPKGLHALYRDKFTFTFYLKITFFLDLVLYSLAESYQCFTGTCTFIFKINPVSENSRFLEGKLFRIPM